MRFHISVHYSFRVAVVKGLQNFINVKSNIVVGETLVEGSEVNIACVDVFHYQSWSFCHWVSDHIDQINNVDSTSQCLQDFDLSSNLSLFDGFKNFDDNSFIIQGIDSFIYFGVLSSSNFLDNLIIFLGSIIKQVVN